MIPRDSEQPLLFDRRRKGFYLTDNVFIDEYAPQVGAYAVAVYSVLLRHADDKGVAFPGVGYISGQLDISTNTVRNALKKLAEVGVLKIIRRRDPDNEKLNLPNHYELQEINPNLLHHSIDPHQEVVQGLPGDGKGVYHELNPKNTKGRIPIEEEPPNPPSTAVVGGGDVGRDQGFTAEHLVRTLDSRVREQFGEGLTDSQYAKRKQEFTTMLRKESVEDVIAAAKKIVEKFYDYRHQPLDQALQQVRMDRKMEGPKEPQKEKIT